LEVADFYTGQEVAVLVDFILAGYEASTAVVLKISVFWYTMPYVYNIVSICRVKE
jgi:hypothetical protein